MAGTSFDTFGLKGQVLRPPKPMGRVHHHHEVELNFCFAGRTVYLLQGRMIELSAGEVAVFWGATPHTLVSVDEGSELAWITVPMPWFWAWDLPAAFKQRLMRGEWLVGKPAGGLGGLGRFPVTAWVHELKDAGPLRTQAILLELHACLLWTAEHAEPTARNLARGRSADAVQLQRVEKMSRFIGEGYTRGIVIADVARAAGVHPNYAMPLFRRVCGVTILGYMTRYRVAHAQRLLITSERKVIDVATDSGFRSLSSFYEAFTRIVGTTPHAYRRRMRET